MTVDTHLVQRRLFDAVLDAEPPFWLPEVDLAPEGWHLHESGEFPHVIDTALREPEEKPDAH